ncbi:hypothetical protein [Neisseria wadsworthii]|uniref:Uncharacterized protein n=1 Tax=Neisseria wadsworthii 9715 TaxID=1030841 RepID=G4CM64_9NEIS|nr:hypothetical protein [Neisseria wadsworthii]EGZ51144.1 hypothetical protein HMPREF9370_0173 [Neisseria wadsworthii 9715]QMT36230.1 hypothetical protein H3L96_03060 [Neisseria wadsworthii]
MLGFLFNRKNKEQNAPVAKQPVVQANRVKFALDKIQAEEFSFDEKPMTLDQMRMLELAM